MPLHLGVAELRGVLTALTGRALYLFPMHFSRSTFSRFVPEATGAYATIAYNELKLSGNAHREFS